MPVILFLVNLVWVIHVHAADGIGSRIGQYCPECPARMEHTTGAYILEYGEEALISRAWLTDNAVKSIDVQYFIWSTDNIGILASESMLRAAERGVRVRVIVDDLLIDAEDKTLLALDAHPNVEIRIYNPKHSVGTSSIKRALNVATNFRGVNQRMHDKTAIFDGVVGITGGRNMADEYFDYNQEYNFRDRDILLLGKAVADMTENFEEFWNSDLSVSVTDLLDSRSNRMSGEEVEALQAELHAYAGQPDRFEPEIRELIAHLDRYFPELVQQLVWNDATFISDKPGKNDNKILLSGGGETTSFLGKKIAEAKHSVLIQSPYLVFPDEGIDILKDRIKAGVKVTISTNSLASTDNLMAFGGYQKQRKKLLKAGVIIHEFKPHPAIQTALIKRYPRLKDKDPVFAIHAKSMVIDGQQIYIGTFNLDPRSANLNTEVGVFIENAELAKQLTSSIERDIHPENSWRTTPDYNPDGEVTLGKRFKARVFRSLPMKKVL